MRDLVRLWAQVLAIALLLTTRVTTLILGHGAYSSLHDPRALYYEENCLADVFADVIRAPRALLVAIKEISRALAAEAGIAKLGLMDIDGLKEPGSILFVSLPD